MTSNRELTYREHGQQTRRLTLPDDFAAYRIEVETDDPALADRVFIPNSDFDINLPDRIHPNAAGHAILAENVWPYLEPLLNL